MGQGLSAVSCVASDIYILMATPWRHRDEQRKLWTSLVLGGVLVLTSTPPSTRSTSEMWQRVCQLQTAASGS